MVYRNLLGSALAWYKTSCKGRVSKLVYTKYCILYALYKRLGLIQRGGTCNVENVKIYVVWVCSDIFNSFLTVE